MKDFVEFVAKGLVDKPEDVQVVEVEGEQGAVLERFRLKSHEVS